MKIVKYIYINKAVQVRSLKNIKAMKDFNEFIYITFKFPHKTGYCLCEKALLQTGELKDLYGLINKYK